MNEEHHGLSEESIKYNRFVAKILINNIFPLCEKYKIKIETLQPTTSFLKEILENTFIGWINSLQLKEYIKLSFDKKEFIDPKEFITKLLSDNQYWITDRDMYDIIVKTFKENIQICYQFVQKNEKAFGIVLGKIYKQIGLREEPERVQNIVHNLLNYNKNASFEEFEYYIEGLQ